MAVAAYLPFLTFYAIFIHANVSWGFGRLGWLVASPKFHRWHHTSEEEGLDKNFAGLFPLLDILLRSTSRFKGLAASDDDIFFGIVRWCAAMIMLKDVGVDPVPNYT